MFKRIAAAAAFAAAALLPFVASAHEVYVLSTGEIAKDTAEPSFNMIAVALNDLSSFAFWAFIAILVVAIVFAISIMRPLERALAGSFARMRPYAPAVARVTVGIGLLASAYFQASFGPELPFSATFGTFAPLITFLLAALGTLIVIGWWARAAGLAALCIFGWCAYVHGEYMLTYANYCGEFIVLLILGSHRASVHSITGLHERFHASYHRVIDRIQDLAFPVLRIAFGISLLYASVYAKILHNNLALDIAQLPLAGHVYPLAHYFGLEPHFLVLGAAIVEIVIACFFIFGIEIRFTALFLLFWLALSLWYFGETVWPHIILIGIPIAFIMHGYDKYSLEGRFFKTPTREPVL